MSRLAKAAISVLIGAALSACAGRPAAKPLIDPFPMRFPLIEAGRIPIEGQIVGQPRLRDGILYYATRGGRLTALVVRSGTVLWQFETDRPISAGPELAAELVLVRDDGGILYGIASPGGRIALKTELGSDAAAPALPGFVGGELLLPAADGSVRRLDLDGREIGAFLLPVAEAAITARPVAVHGKEGRPDYTLFGRSDGRLTAVDGKGRTVWEFRAEGAITSGPVVLGRRVYFGTEARMFYCLGAKKGHKKWSRRLQGAPIHPAAVSGSRLVVAAGNSVVYVLSARGGSIIGWEPAASRLVYEPAAAGSFILVSSAAPGLGILDAAAGRKIEEVPTAGFLAAGALWSPPFVVLFEEDPETGLQTCVLLTPRPSQAARPVAKPARMP